MNLETKSKLLLLIQQFLIGVDYLNSEAEAYDRRRRRNAIIFLKLQQMPLEKYYFQTRGRLLPRFWVKKRSTHWWDVTVQENFSDEDWLENFRMTKSTFKIICLRLKPYLEPLPNSVRKAMSIEKKVAIALYKLASGCEYRVVAKQFGTNKCMVHKCVYSVVLAIIEEFEKEYLCMPNAVACQEIARNFEKACGIPNIIGAINGSHIPILPPRDGYYDYINCKGWSSYSMMAVVDCNYRFRNVTCKHPGSNHDAQVLEDSNLYKYNSLYIPQHSSTINEVEIPYFLLGDPAYPLLPWLQKGYKGILIPEEESYNAYCSLGRVVVENAFGRLKARFRCLLKRMDINYKFVPMIVKSCTILHNIVETHKEVFLNKWMKDVKEGEVIFPQPVINARELDDLDASVIRDALKTYMLQFPLRKSNLQLV